MQQYGANAWRVYNYRLEVVGKSLDKAIEEMNDRVTEVNRTRKNDQVSAATFPRRVRTKTEPLLADGGWETTYGPRAKMDRAHLERPTD
jgi:pre-mRNA-splicing factor SPF27